MREVIVTGSRHWMDAEAIHIDLDLFNPDVVIHGDCETGADEIAKAWAFMRGVTQIPYPAEWRTPDGKLDLSAGPRRNRLMVDKHPKALVLAYPLVFSKGTRDCIKYARLRGLEVIVHGEEPLRAA